MKQLNDDYEVQVQAILKEGEDSEGCALYTSELIYTSDDPVDALKYASDFGKGKYCGYHDSFNVPYDHGYDKVLIEVYSECDGYIGEQRFLSMKDYKELMKA